mmetsp:Transcript_45/g.123  ORF Transcript_45/g.123 Transcript_45/m.123 type:complete len:212 (+) Transcript_45:85-720(+)
MDTQWAMTMLLLMALVAVRGEPAVSGACSPGASPLTAGLERYEDEVELGGQPHRYILQGMQPSTGYEIRISYTAAIPARFSLELQQCSNEPEAPLKEGQSLLASEWQRRKGRRQLLDTEKIIISSDALLPEQGGRESLLLVWASTHSENQPPADEVVLYNIVLAELWMGLPLDAAPVGLALVTMLILAIWAATRVSGPVAIGERDGSHKSQ